MASLFQCTSSLSLTTVPNSSSTPCVFPRITGSETLFKIKPSSLSRSLKNRGFVCQSVQETDTYSFEVERSKAEAIAAYKLKLLVRVRSLLVSNLLFASFLDGYFAQQILDNF